MRRQLTGMTVLICACSSGHTPATGATTPSPVAQRSIMMLPDNPCELLTAAQVSSAAGIAIQSARRIPDIGEIVRAQREKRPPRAGVICNYDSNAAVGDIVIAIPDPSVQSVTAFRKERDEYMRNFPGSAQHVDGIGYEAWIAGGNTLHVLAARNAQFIVGTRYWQPNSRDVVQAVAKSIMSRITQ